MEVVQILHSRTVQWHHRSPSNRFAGNQAVKLHIQHQHRHELPPSKASMILSLDSRFMILILKPWLSTLYDVNFVSTMGGKTQFKLERSVSESKRQTSSTGMHYFVQNSIELITLCSSLYDGSHTRNSITLRTLLSSRLRKSNLNTRFMLISVRKSTPCYIISMLQLSRQLLATCSSILTNLAVAVMSIR